MNWKAQFAEYEKSFGVHAEIDWKPAIALAQKVLENSPDDVEAYIRAIYLLHNILDIILFKILQFIVKKIIHQIINCLKYILNVCY